MVEESFPPQGPFWDGEEAEMLLRVLESGKWSPTVGEVTGEFEREVAEYLGVRYASAVSNGTVALHLALRAIGVGPGDEVVVPDFTFVSTATSVLHQNAVPVFADIDRKYFTLSPESLEAAITRRTKAIIAVHLAGQPANMDEIMEIAGRRGLYVIEDCAQAFGASIDGVKVGCFGDVACFSFYATKNIATGEGGMVVTDNPEVDRLVRLYRDHGQTSKYYYEVLGYNYRMTEFQAAIGLAQLHKIDKLNSIRRRLADAYTSQLEGFDKLILPEEKPGTRHVWHIYQILLKDEKLARSRDEIVSLLREKGVPATVVYPQPLHEAPIFREYRGHGLGCPYSCPLRGGKPPKWISCPNASWVSRRVITLPTSPRIPMKFSEKVGRAFKEVMKNYAAD